MNENNDKEIINNNNDERTNVFEDCINYKSDPKKRKELNECENRINTRVFVIPFIFLIIVLFVMFTVSKISLYL